MYKQRKCQGSNEERPVWKPEAAAYLGLNWLLIFVKIAGSPVLSFMSFDC